MSFTHFLDPVALGIVFGGSALVTALRSTKSDLAGAGRALGILFRADPAADADAARAALGKIEKLAQARSIACVDRFEHAGRFVRLAAAHVADAPSRESFAMWAEDEIAAMSSRHARAAGVWRALAETAPGMGMLGTIVGLSAMFAGMDDGARIGPAMAVAMLTTFYGILLSAGIAAPVAARLERLSAEEAEWRRRTCRRLELLLADNAAEEPRKLRSVA